jgi:hypothetical protein
MSVPAQTITQTDLRVYAATRDFVHRETQDHVFSHDPGTAIFLDKQLGDFGGVRMRGAGRMDQRGGASVQTRVRLGAHTGSKWMSGAWDTHNVSPDDNVRLTQANWMHASGALVLSDTDKAIHQGTENIADFVADQTESVMLALADDIGTALQAVTNPANSITSLYSLIGANDTTVQNLNAQTYSAWNSRGVSARGTAAASISFASGSFAAQGIADMRTARQNCTEGNIGPTVILGDSVNYNRYEGSLQPQERFAGSMLTADASFNALAFHQIPFLVSPKTPSGVLYFLRPGRDGVSIVNLSGISFEFKPFKQGSNQETHVSELQWKGQFVIKNRLYGNNRLISITD